MTVVFCVQRRKLLSYDPKSGPLLENPSSKVRGRLIEDNINKALFDLYTFVPVPRRGLVSMLGWMSIEFLQEGVRFSMRGTIGALQGPCDGGYATVAHLRYCPQSIGPDAELRQ